MQRLPQNPSVRQSAQPPKSRVHQQESFGSMRYLPVIGEEDQLAVHNALRAVHESLLSLDQLIFDHGRALELSQPPSPGKISIRFLRRQWGGGDSRHPQFIQWYQSSVSNRWLYKRLKPNEVIRKMKTYPAFATTEESTRGLLNQTRALVVMREKLMEDLGTFRRTLAMHTAKTMKASEPYWLKIAQQLPDLELRRAEIILGVREAKKFAAQVLPEEGVVDVGTMPRFDRKGRTRGRVTDRK